MVGWDVSYDIRWDRRPNSPHQVTMRDDPTLAASVFHEASEATLRADIVWICRKWSTAAPLSTIT